MAERLTKPPYRALSSTGERTGNWYTQALFWETSQGRPMEERVIHPVFSLYNDRPGCINCRKTFLELRDITGYKWAIKYLGDYAHWLRLIDIPWFKTAYESWKAELIHQLKSEAINKIVEIASGDSSQSLPAAKYIVEEGWKGSKRGRPSKSEMDAELKRATKEAEATEEDFERIGLKVISGGKRS